MVAAIPACAHMNIAMHRISARAVTELFLKFTMSTPVPGRFVLSLLKFDASSWLALRIDYRPKHIASQQAYLNLMMRRE